MPSKTVVEVYQFYSICYCIKDTTTCNHVIRVGKRKSLNQYANSRGSFKETHSIFYLAD